MPGGGSTLAQGSLSTERCVGLIQSYQAPGQLPSQLDWSHTSEVWEMCCRISLLGRWIQHGVRTKNTRVVHEAAEGIELPPHAGQLLRTGTRLP